MKKLVTVLCMLACVMGLTACGNTTETVKDSTTANMENASGLTTTCYIPLMASLYTEDKGENFLSEYTRQEVEAMFEQQELYVDGNAFLSGVSSFMSEFDNLGDIIAMDEPVVTYGDGEILVSVAITGANKSGTAEFIYADNIFLELKSCVLNSESTIGELMSKAGMNTILGMCTVFVVLILISFIISLFGFIPKLQEAFKKKDKQEVSVDNTIAQIIEKEELVEEDDTEIVAVIAAAIAAYEGAQGSDGFVVRSIRRRR